MVRRLVELGSDEGGVVVRGRKGRIRELKDSLYVVNLGK